MCRATRKWLTHSLTHSCVQMSITKNDELQRFFFPSSIQTTDTPLKASKTAPTTSTFCCILFSSEETCVIRTLPPICSPYVHMLFFSGIWLLGISMFFTLCILHNMRRLTLGDHVERLSLGTDLMTFFVNLRRVSDLSFLSDPPSQPCRLVPNRFI